MKLFHLDDMRLRDKFLVIYLLCVFIPILVSNLVFYNVTTENVREQRLEDIERAMEQIKNEFRAEVEDAVAVSSGLHIDYNVNAFLEVEYATPHEYVSAYESYFRHMLNNYTPIYNAVQNIKIFVNNPTLLHSGNIGLLTDEVKQTEWYQKLSETTGTQPILVRTRADDRLPTSGRGDARDTFSIIQRMKLINNADKFEKILKIDMNMSAVERVFNNLNLNGVVYLLNDLGQIEFATDPGLNWIDETLFYEDLQLPGDTLAFETVYDDVRYLRGWRVIGIVSDEEVFREVRKSRELVIWLAAFNLMFATLIIFWITRSMHVRLRNILKHMKKVKNEQFVTMQEVETRDEIGQLHGEFNRMTLQLKRLIDDVYKADIQRKNLEIERRKAQLNALQSQINPHFLFNALETIRMRSLIKNETETAKIIHNMAKLFRSSLTWKKDRVTVAEEIDFILCFLEIQQYRFGDRLTFELQVEPETERVLIPKMVFLPFVENASIHGIEPLKKGGRIDIRFWMPAPGRLAFTVRDNGVGMSREQVETIHGYLESEKEIGERIGVQNVIYRLTMLYGDKFHLDVDSSPGKGTLIRIEIPVELPADHP
jgi:two-component system sensor histidine kinase YesM